MVITVLGCDPSFRNWGLARAKLDLTTGILDDLELRLVETKPNHSKQVRQNSKDIADATFSAKNAMDWFNDATVVFVEVPVGSQSANGMKSYGIVVGILGAFSASGAQLIEVNPTENKVVLTGSKTASKEAMIEAAVNLYPDANWIRDSKGRLLNKNEHLADAIGAIHAGVQTPAFQNLMKLYAKV